MDMSDTPGSRPWTLAHVFREPVLGDRVALREVALELPPGVASLLRQHWRGQLEAKQAALAILGVPTRIAPYPSATTAEALYEGVDFDRPCLWPGPCLTLRRVAENDRGVELEVAALTYPFIAALGDERIAGLFTARGEHPPSPALAVCVFVVTADDLIVLSVRGPRTSVYPGRLYGLGGNPERADQGVVAAAVNEIADEAGIAPDELEGASFRFGGIVTDGAAFAGKPDLIGWVSARLDAADVSERVCARPEPERPGDAVAVVFAPSSEGELFDYLARRTDAAQFCPSALGGLVLYGFCHYGRPWAHELLARMTK